MTVVTAGGGALTLAFTGAGSCPGMASASVVGESFTGSVVLSNGGKVLFSGVFS